MAKVKITGHASGTGVITVTAPNTSTDRTITLPDATGTLLNSDGSAANLTAIPAANITGTLPAISGANLTGVNAVNGGRKNMIINGAMNVAQRGTSSTGFTAGGDGYKTVDRYYMGINGTSGVFTVTQDTDAPVGFSSSTKWDCTTADTSLAASDILYVEQKIEAQDLQHLNYGTASALQTTLSFWVKSNKTGTYVAWFYQDDDVRHVQSQYTVNTADTWEKKTCVVPADTTGVIDNNDGSGFRVRFILASGTSYTSGTEPTAWEANVSANRYVGQTVNIADSTANYFNITGIQLEVGSTATDFEYRSYGEEFALCQRYYEQTATLTGVGGGITLIAQNTAGVQGLHFDVRKRANPTVVVYGRTGVANSISFIQTGGVVTNCAAQTIATDGCHYISVGATLTSGGGYEVHYSADAEL